MRPFTYLRPRGIDAALAALATIPPPRPLAGGTCLLDLMKQGVERPDAVLDLSFSPDLAGVAVLPGGGLRIGAATTLSQVARHRAAASGWPLLHQSILGGLTPQLRNAATIGGNVMQRPRCIYFREPGFACNKRDPGAGCAAQGGAHFAHAVFGASASCIAVHPSDCCVALTALDATVQVAGPSGVRTVPISDLHRLAGDDPTRDTTLAPDELVTAVTIPPQAGRGAYVKGPEEGFALASCAALLEQDGGRVTRARIVLGGVAHKPWRSAPAEAALLGRPPGSAAISTAIEAALAEATADAQTAFRLDLLRGVMAEALSTAAAA